MAKAVAVTVVEAAVVMAMKLEMAAAWAVEVCVELAGASLSLCIATGVKRASVRGSHPVVVAVAVIAWPWSWQ